MCLSGCQAKLGCSIVLSGPSPLELKQVRRALKDCLRYARIITLEKEYLHFMKPDMDAILSSKKPSVFTNNLEGSISETEVTVVAEGRE